MGLGLRLRVGLGARAAEAHLVDAPGQLRALAAGEQPLGDATKHDGQHVRHSSRGAALGAGARVGLLRRRPFEELGRRGGGLPGKGSGAVRDRTRSGNTAFSAEPILKPRLRDVGEQMLHFHEGTELLRQSLLRRRVASHLRLSSELLLALLHSGELLLQLAHALRVRLRRSLQEDELSSRL